MDDDRKQPAKKHAPEPESGWNSDDSDVDSAVSKLSEGLKQYKSDFAAQENGDDGQIELSDAVNNWLTNRANVMEEKQKAKGKKMKSQTKSRWKQKQKRKYVENHLDLEQEYNLEREVWTRRPPENGFVHPVPRRRSPSGRRRRRRSPSPADHVSRALGTVEKITTTLDKALGVTTTLDKALDNSHEMGMAYGAASPGRMQSNQEDRRNQDRVATPRQDWNQARNPSYSLGRPETPMAQTPHAPHYGVPEPHYGVPEPHYSVQGPHGPHHGAHGPHHGAHAPHHGAHTPHYGAHTPHYGAHTPHYGAHTPHHGAHAPHYGAHTPHFPHFGVHAPHYGEQAPHIVLQALAVVNKALDDSQTVYAKALDNSTKALDSSHEMGMSYGAASPGRMQSNHGMAYGAASPGRMQSNHGMAYGAASPGRMQSNHGMAYGAASPGRMQSNHGMAYGAASPGRMQSNQQDNSHVSSSFDTATLPPYDRSEQHYHHYSGHGPHDGQNRADSGVQTHGCRPSRDVGGTRRPRTPRSETHPPRYPRSATQAGGTGPSPHPQPAVQAEETIESRVVNVVQELMGVLGQNQTKLIDAISEMMNQHGGSFQWQHPVPRDPVLQDAMKVVQGFFPQLIALCKGDEYEALDCVQNLLDGSVLLKKSLQPRRIGTVPRPFSQREKDMFLPRRDGHDESIAEYSHNEEAKRKAKDHGVGPNKRHCTRLGSEDQNEEESMDEHDDGEHDGDGDDERDENFRPSHSFDNRPPFSFGNLPHSFA